VHKWYLREPDTRQTQMVFERAPTHAKQVQMVLERARHTPNKCAHITSLARRANFLRACQRSLSEKSSPEVSTYSSKYVYRSSSLSSVVNNKDVTLVTATYSSKYVYRSSSLSSVVRSTSSNSLREVGSTERRACHVGGGVRLCVLGCGDVHVCIWEYKLVCVTRKPRWAVPIRNLRLRC
jgi:hypothetical protein